MKQLKPYLLPIPVIAGLYGLNRLVPAGSGVLQTLRANYFADLLAGALILCILDAALILFRYRPVRRLLPATAFLLACGIFWEYVTPLYRADSVGDPWDLLAYWLGGAVMLLWLEWKKRVPPGGKRGGDRHVPHTPL